MTGSQAPQRALRRLDRLGLRTDRLGAVTAPAALLGDPLAELDARPLDETVLDAVLLRLESGATAGGRGATPASGRFRRSGKGGLRSRSSVLPSRSWTDESPAVHRSVVDEPSVRVRRIHVAAPAHALAATSRMAVPVVAGAEGRASPFVRAAGRVPGGAAAVATPVAAEWTASESATESSGTSVLQTVLARAVAQPVASEESRRGGSSGLAPDAPRRYRPSLEDALVPTAGALRTRHEQERQPVTHLAGVQPADYAHTAERVEPESAPPLRDHGSGGLAELVRRWESVHLRDDEPAAVRLARDPDPVAGVEAETALARAVERLLAAELRRSGIEVDVG